MRKWLVSLFVASFIVLTIASVALFLRHRASVRGFSALSVPQRSLALYDAFWAALDANYYNPKFLKTPQMRALRAQWRVKAEAADALRIYWNVLEPMTREFPHSHVAVQPSFTLPQVLEVMVPGNDERSVNAKLAFTTGPGFEAPVIRRPDGSHWIVGDVFADSAAAKAGITPGWTILSTTNTLESRPLRTFCSSEFEAGAGLPTIKIKFDLEPKPSRRHFEVKQLAEGVTYVRFDLFGEVGEPDKVIAAIDSAGPGGLVLDLRGNVGGLNSDLKRIAGRVLGDKVLIGTILGRASSEEERTNADRHYSGPLVMLIGPVSGSSAEILAASVQDHARGTLIGRASNGSVLLAQSFPLPDGGWIHVPIGDFLRIDGRHIEGIGVAPDIEIVPTLEDVRAGRDPTLARALGVLQK